MEIKLKDEQKQEIKEVLNGFGLHNNDQMVYLAALQAGKSSLTPLALKTHLALTTVQSIVKRLMNRGLLITTKHGSRHLYEALSPKKLVTLAEQQVRGLEQITPLLQQLQNSSQGETKFKVYYDDRMSDIFHEALHAKTKLVYEIISAENIQEILGEKFHFSSQRMIHGIHLKSLRVQSKEIKKYSPRLHAKELREAKFLPKNFNFSINILAWDKTVAFFTPKSEGIAWTIQSPSMAEFYKQLFAMLWELSKPMVTLNE